MAGLVQFWAFHWTEAKNREKEYNARTAGFGFDSAFDTVLQALNTTHHAHEHMIRTLQIDPRLTTVSLFPHSRWNVQAHQASS